MTLFNLLVTPQFVSVKYNFDLKSSVWDESDDMLRQSLHAKFNEFFFYKIYYLCKSYTI